MKVTTGGQLFCQGWKKIRLCVILAKLIGSFLRAKKDAELPGMSVQAKNTSGEGMIEGMIYEQKIVFRTANDI